MMATLVLSQGTPMLVAGDEFGRSQGGNNNAYCQDTEISWVDWGLKEKGETLLRFTTKLLALRRRLPILRRGRFLTGALNERLGVHDVRWINAAGHDMAPEDWQDANTRCFGMLIDGRAQATGIVRSASDATLLVVFNSYHDLVGFTLPACEGGDGWQLLADTNAPDIWGGEFASGAQYEVTGRSLLLFQLATVATHPNVKPMEPEPLPKVVPGGQTMPAALLPD